MQPATHRRSTNGCNRPHVTLSAWAEVRAARGLSLRDYEALTGINRGDLSKIEHGHLCPTPEQARRMLEP